MPTTKYKDERANRCADFFFPDGKIPQWFDELVERREREAAEAFRSGLPPEALRRVHTPWEMRSKANPSEVVRVDFFFESIEGREVPLFKRAEEPVLLARQVFLTAEWEGFEFRPFCWTWEEAGQAAKAAGA